ncbi:terminase small subunit [Lentilactobacillus senioris]|uniref:terminase small subunit n=1 Tax=Lentilactobacillus senioris TaxID=931534 RepID=UPI00227ECA9C|nr:terminase small subunit [Lentilactobacillus senioris]MCY9807469.1 terminase small subunit [Lentilactobacillus senioris]
MAKLTTKQQKFADEYIISGNATQAAIKAGYSENSAQQIGTENLLKPVISNYLKKQLNEIHNDKIDSQQDVMEFLSRVRRGEEKETIVTPSGLKVETSPKIADRVKAAELIGKRYAMWTDKQDITANIEPVKIIDDVPGDDTDG